MTAASGYPAFSWSPPWKVWRFLLRVMNGWCSPRACEGRTQSGFYSLWKRRRSYHLTVTLSGMDANCVSAGSVGLAGEVMNTQKKGPTLTASTQGADPILFPWRDQRRGNGIATSDYRARCKSNLTEIPDN